MIVPEASSNPVHERDGMWWFYDETWADEYGPYASQELANKGCREYGLMLDGKGIFVPPDTMCPWR